MNHNTLKTMVRVGAYQKPCIMKYRQTVGVSATTPQPKRVCKYLYGMQGQAPFILNK
jgi:hypothetical protein